MAKKKELSLEEKLEAALVPREEWPYEVPENWCWTKVKNVVNIYRGVSYKKGDVLNENKSESCLVMRGGNIQEDSLIFEDNVFISKNLVKDTQLVKKHDIIVVSSTGSKKVIGRTGIIYEDMPQVTFGAFLTLLRPDSMLNRKYINYFFKTEMYRQQIRSVAKGVNINNIKNGDLENILFPLAPLTEQNRIVSRIELIFEQLDRAKDLIQEALDSFENRKAAILHKAFTGELTKKWREENGVSLESWKEVTLKQCGEWYGGGTPAKTKKEFWDNGNIMWITPKDMKDNVIVDSKDHITLEGVDNSSARLIKEAGILFVTRSGILRRLLPVAICNGDFTVNQDLKVLVPKNIDINFLFWCCVCNEADIRKNCSKNGTTVESISTDKLYSYKIKVPCLPEQKAIVSYIERMINDLDSVDKLIDLENEIDLIKKSILSKAFRGELGTNNESAISAIELMKKIIK